MPLKDPSERGHCDSPSLSGAPGKHVLSERGEALVQAKKRPRPIRPSRTGPSAFGDASRSTVDGPVAPGAQILTRAGTARRTGGIAVVVALDGRLSLLTCGHLFVGATSDVEHAFSATPIATLRQNLLERDPPLDAAVCDLTSEGKRLLARSMGAPTWLRGYCEPSSEIVSWPADFWPSHRAGSHARVLSVSACSAATEVLFPTGPTRGFVECEGAVVPGDSGSLLSVDDLYLGLCSGQVQGTWSYFTPIAAVLDRLCEEHEEVSIWHPDAGIRA